MRDKLNLILVVDTSGSMKGKGIGAANDAVLNVIQLTDRFAKNETIECTVDVINYGDDAMDLGECPITEYLWKDVTATGVTSFGKACEVLSSYFGSKSRHPSSVCEKVLIVLFTDGTSTDDYTPSLCHLFESVHFQRALKVAIIIGRNFDDEIPIAFTGNPQNVLISSRIEEIQNKIYDLFIVVN